MINNVNHSLHLELPDTEGTDSHIENHEESVEGELDNVQHENSMGNVPNGEEHNPLQAEEYETSSENYGIHESNGDHKEIEAAASEKDTDELCNSTQEGAAEQQEGLSSYGTEKSEQSDTVGGENNTVDDALSENMQHVSITSDNEESLKTEL